MIYLWTRQFHFEEFMLRKYDRSMSLYSVEEGSAAIKEP